MAPNSRSRRFTTPTEKYDPYRNFNFVIKLDDEVVAACRKMSGLMASVEAVRFRAGNSDSSGDEVLPGRVSYEPVTLESGLTDNPTFQRWANALIQHSHDTQKNTVGDPSLRREVEIEVRDIDNKTIARRFTLHRAWVSKYTALSDLAADGNEVLIESAQIEHEGFTQTLPQPSPPAGASGAEAGVSSVGE